MAKIFYSNQFPSSRTTELVVLSGEDLRINRRLISKNAFVTVRYDAAADCGTTAMDTECGSYPRWGQKFVLELPAHAPAVILEVQCKTAFGTRLVGTASVPVSDFSGGYVPESYLHFLSYRLRDSKGERNGIINISVRTKVPASAAVVGTSKEYTCPASASASASAGERTTVGVPVGNNKSHSNSNINSFGGVVTGVPIWTAYQRNY